MLVYVWAVLPAGFILWALWEFFLGLDTLERKRLIFSLGSVGVAFAVLVLTACAPLSPAQREILEREKAAQQIVLCEHRGGMKRCSRIDRDELDRILRTGM